MITQFKLYESLDDYFLEKPKIIEYQSTLNSKKFWKEKAYARLSTVDDNGDIININYFNIHNVSVVDRIINKVKEILTKIIDKEDEIYNLNMYKNASCSIRYDENICFVIIDDDHIGFAYETIWSDDYDAHEGEILYTNKLKKLADEVKEMIILKRDTDRFGL